jgi:hypothetical protein
MPEGERKRYMLMLPGFHADVWISAGQVVWLYDDEVGPHHQPIVDSDPAQEEPAVDDEGGEAEEDTVSEGGA